MSSTSKQQDANEALVAQVVEVTGSNAVEAAYLLGACANNVEAAVALYFEQGGGSGASTSSAAAASAATDAAAAAALAAAIPIDDDDDVRAPIAPIREQLIGPDDDNFYTAAPPRLARASQRVKVCPLRDFAREGALMEQQMRAAEAAVTSDTFGPSHSRSVTGGPRRRIARAAAMVVAAQSALDKTSSSRLGDLFRPPTDIAYVGSFQTARLRAAELKHWLLVNVQSDNFDSQVLNRDVWSDKNVRGVLKRQFMLWQVDSDSSEGLRFVAFYHCAKLPYVCVIDPRTGEEIWKSTAPKQANMLPDLQQFLRDHNDFSSECADDDAPSTSTKRATIHIDCDDDADEDKAVAGSSTSGGNPKKRTKLLELSEEEQIALAIRNSMQSEGGKSNDVDGDAGSECGSVEEFVDDDTKATCELISYEQQLGSATHELTMLKLRLLNASGVDDEVVQLRWPSDTRLQTLRQYIAQQQPHIPKQESYKLICAYPRKTLEKQHDASTLKELGLHPSANLHVTLDD